LDIGRETDKEARTTVIKMNDENDFEIEKLTEKEIKETHLFKSSQSKEIKSENPIIISIEDSLIGSQNIKTKQSNYGLDLKARVNKYHSTPKDVQINNDFR
jgi:hypothetical protein